MTEGTGNVVKLLHPNPGSTTLEIRPPEKYMKAIAERAREWQTTGSRAAEIMIEAYLDAEEAERSR